MERSTMSAFEAYTAKSELSSATTESETDLSSYWTFAVITLTFVLVSFFCFVIFIFTITAPGVQETTLFDEDLELSGGDGDYGDRDTKSTTENPRERVTSPRLQRKESATTSGMRSTPAVQSTRPAVFPSPSPSSTMPVPVAPAAPTGTVVCTVSNLMPPETSALPLDGACDLLFFESFYKENKNNLSGGYGAIELNARVFLEQARNVNKTQYGISFALTKTLSSADFTTSNFYEMIDDIWNRKIYHFGFLNLYREFSAPEAVREALLALKELYFYIKRINQQRQPSYQILGLSIDHLENFPTVDLMRSIFVPSIFISIGHVSYSDASFPYCQILPPTIRFYPGIHRSKQEKQYGHSMVRSVELLDRVSQLHLNITLAISVGLSGRYYRPHLPNPTFATLNDYRPFKKCLDFNGSRYDDPVKLCPSVVGADWKVFKSDVQLYIMVYSMYLERTFMFDNAHLIKEKVCHSRDGFDKVNYTVAAYDVDFDSSPEGCPELDIKAGAFNRLSTIRPLNEYLRNFTRAYRCSQMNFTRTRAL